MRRQRRCTTELSTRSDAAVACDCHDLRSWPHRPRAVSVPPGAPPSRPSATPRATPRRPSSTRSSASTSRPSSPPPLAPIPSASRGFSNKSSAGSWTAGSGPGWAALEQPWPSRSLPDVPRTYVLCTEDQIIPPAKQREMAARLGVEPIEIASEHAVFTFQPHELAAVLAAQCRST
ncbi:MAG: alpha/beta fold hydrolase [Candidatus Binatia bacterium]